MLFWGRTSLPRTPPKSVVRGAGVPAHAYDSLDLKVTPLTESSAVWAMGLILARACVIDWPGETKWKGVDDFDKVFSFKSDDCNRHNVDHISDVQARFVKSRCIFKSEAVHDAVMYALSDPDSEKTTMAGMLVHMNKP